MAIRKTGDAGSRPQTAEENEVHTTPQVGLTAEVDPQDPQGLSKAAMANLEANPVESAEDAEGL